MKQLRPVLALVLALALMCTGCGSAAPAAPSAPLTVPETPGLYYCESLLEGEARTLYHLILDAVSAMTPSVVIEAAEHPDTDAQQLLALTDAVRRDHPELFWLEQAAQVTTTTRGDVPTRWELAFQYAFRPDQLDEARQQVEAAAAECLDGIDPGASEYDKVLAVYEWVVRRTEYAPARENDQTLYSALVHRQAVCAGYASAVQYLLHRLDIPCARISGTARGGPHAWNLVFVEGEYYYLDATWGDPVFTGEDASDPDYVDYNYFCVTTEQLTRTHTLDPEQTVPECTATACNYYVRERLYLEAYDPEQLVTLLRRALEQGEDPMMRFSTPEVFDDAVYRLFEKSEVFGLLEKAGLSAGELSYLTDRDSLTVTLLV